MENFVALMRRYCIDYTNAHVQSVCDEIMASDYQVTISGRTLTLAEYHDAVSAAFRRYPTLMLTVHEMILAGDRLAMRFSEHGAVGRSRLAIAAWPGIALYQWNGARLVRCRVEQDFLGRDEQSESGQTEPMPAPHPDPWATTQDREPSDVAERAVKQWLARVSAEPGGLFAAPALRLLESGDGSSPLLDDQRVVVDDLFSAGDHVAAAVTVHGVYLGGLPNLGANDPIGRRGQVSATLLAKVDNAEVVHVKLVRDRWGLIRRLRH